MTKLLTKLIDFLTWLRGPEPTDKAQIQDSPEHMERMAKHREEIREFWKALHDPSKIKPGCHYICFDCAKEAQKGKKYTNGGVFTSHTGICDKCGETNNLGHVRDFGLDETLTFRNLTPLD